ncbi:MAG: sugar phosphate isomerase/epimerase [Synergistaceae bacterium]|nr:sugar phosphate isomerase/epimerase [Synergistaceae bacterium]
MKLAASNIAWTPEHDSEIYNLMQELGFRGLEIAPTRLFSQNPYEHLHEAKEFADNMMSKYNLEICSMQSIWFGMSHKIAGSIQERQELLNYTREALTFASVMKCHNIVFGCPRNRCVYKPGDYEIICEFLINIADIAESLGIIIALEANPKIYNTNFANTTDEAANIIMSLNHPALRLNLDTGTILANSEKLSGINISLVNHVHISEPGLKAITRHNEHQELAVMLRQSNYSKFISIEISNANDINRLCENMYYISQIFN